jgi:hypothetical protein
LPAFHSRTAAAAQEWRTIQTFAAECRRHWPGAKITLRPNDPTEFAHSARIPVGVSDDQTEEQQNE